jgi:hypothetical protein
VRLENLNTLLLGENNFTGNFANLQLQMPNIITLDIDAENKKGVLVTLDEEVNDN